VRHFEPGGKAANDAGDDVEALALPEFLALGEEELVPETNPEERPPFVERSPERVEETEGPEVAHGVVEGAVAGPNHVLPTGGTARFASALGTEDFVKRMSVIQYAEAGLREAAPHLAELARVEGLDGHGAAAAVRIERMGGTT